MYAFFIFLTLFLSPDNRKKQIFMELEIHIVVAVIGVGVLVGFINTLAGSGSLLSLPLLIALGLPANVANGTNRIGILMQSIVATSSFKKNKVFEWKEGLWLSAPAVVGSLAGAYFAIGLTNETMETAIGILLVIMFVLMIYKPNKWLKEQAGDVNAKPGVWQILIFFAIGFYGGFIQAGVGFFLLAGLVLGAGFDLIKANAIKVLIVLLYTPFALAVFMYNNQVNYLYGFILGIGNMIGAYLASRFAMGLGAKYVRIFLMVVLFVASLKLLGIYEWFLG